MTNAPRTAMRPRGGRLSASRALVVEVDDVLNDRCIRAPHDRVSDLDDAPALGDVPPGEPHDGHSAAKPQRLDLIRGRHAAGQSFRHLCT
ncbi:hypothetical protein, partial [Streptomyces rochei]|uniref:hypothetical protein n=1 Tax=Streptomyces rochei TaxID=1928 RepID=UPI003D9EDD70